MRPLPLLAMRSIRGATTCTSLRSLQGSLLCSALCSMMCACSPGLVDGGAPLEHDQALGCASEAPLHSVWVPTRVSPARHIETQSGPTVIYLNRLPTTLSGGYDDAPHNGSSVVASTGIPSVSLPGYPGSDGAWQQVVACVADEFKRFNVSVTDQRPSSGDYVMAMFGGQAGVLGFPSNVGGVAPLDSFGCSSVQNAVAFIFSGAVGASPTLNCEIAAQEIAHTFSLDHELLAADPMTYLQYGGHKTFQDMDVSCGEFAARACVCGRPSQNSVRILGEHLGPATGSAPPSMGDTTPPAVLLVSPSSGSTLPEGELTIEAQATDAGGIADVSLHYQDARGPLIASCGDGRIGCIINGDRWRFTVEGARGTASFHVEARDTAGNVGRSSTHTLTLGAATGNPPPSTGAMSIEAHLDTDAFAQSRTLVARVTIHSAASITAATLVWTDATGATSTWPLCPSTEGGAYATTVRIAFAAGARSFVVHATDAAGHTATSAALPFSVE